MMKCIRNFNYRQYSDSALEVSEIGRDEKFKSEHFPNEIITTSLAFLF